MNFKGKNVAVLGFGIEGKDAAKFLKKRGANVSILDQKYSSDYLSALQKYDIIVRSPVVYRYIPEISKIEESCIRITSPIHIFLNEFGGVVIGVTGTKGKGTTSTLIY